MELVTPGIGLVFWMLLTFLILMFILTKFAWKPILNMLKERENSIDEALQAAEKAKADTIMLHASNEQLLEEAKRERVELLKEARKIEDQIIAASKEEAAKEAHRILEIAHESIRKEKADAMNELKGQVAALAIEVAEKIIRQELEKDEKQKKLIQDWVENIKFN